MSEQTRSKPFSFFTLPNPFRDFQHEQARRFGATVDQWEDWQEKGVTQMTTTVDEMGRLMKATLDYSVELQTQMGKQTLEAWRSTLASMAATEEGAE